MIVLLCYYGQCPIGYLSKRNRYLPDKKSILYHALQNYDIEDVIVYDIDYLAYFTPIIIFCIFEIDNICSII
jgi:hypothetical protein